MEYAIFKEYERRYAVNGQQLANARVRLTGMTQTQFAAHCGWTSSYQSQLERGTVVTVSESTRNVILWTIKEGQMQ